MTQNNTELQVGSWGEMFKKYNLVGLKASYLETSENNYSLRNRRYYDSFTILSQKDIGRGYYIDSFGSKISLTLCEVKENYNEYYRFLNESLRGKHLQTIGLHKFIRMITNPHVTLVNTYIRYKGNKTLVTGHVVNNMIYFNGWGKEYYKAKLKTTSCGRWLGININENTLSSKQILKCSEVKDG